MEKGEINAAIKIAREFRNYTQEYVASSIGVSQSYYSKLENGHFRISQAIIQRLCKALDVASPALLIQFKTADPYTSLSQYHKAIVDLSDKLNELECRLTRLESYSSAN